MSFKLFRVYRSPLDLSWSDDDPVNEGNWFRVKADINVVSDQTTPSTSRLTSVSMSKLTSVTSSPSKRLCVKTSPMKKALASFSKSTSLTSSVDIHAPPSAKSFFQLDQTATCSNTSTEIWSWKLLPTLKLKKYTLSRLNVTKRFNEPWKLSRGNFYILNTLGDLS